ncbi:hypothetical protein DFJ73DRAFT_792883 [Zopfochytrium polystomum]|nr:hypothetical protein DFJ73DRAFT_792883 [Zopfochytrium polystomum]
MTLPSSSASSPPDRLVVEATTTSSSSSSSSAAAEAAVEVLVLPAGSGPVSSSPSGSTAAATSSSSPSSPIIPTPAATARAASPPKMPVDRSDTASITGRRTLTRGGSTLRRKQQTLDREIPWQVKFPAAEHKKGENNIRTTKYTVLTFIPLLLFYQFSRFYNFYFLLGALTVFYGSSSLSPFSLVSPLIIVLIFAAFKEAVEDYSRYVTDRDANGAPVKLFRNGAKVDAAAKDVQGGDVIYIVKGEKLPVDAIVLSTSYDDGTCFVETAELDGETNLKRRTAINALSHYTKPEDIAQLKIIFASLSMSNMLLRGAVLRNTDFAWGVVVYTGHNTKIIKNLKTTGLKSSRMEKWLNWLVAGAFVYNAILLLGSTLLEWFHYKDVQEKETARLAAGITDYVVEWYIGPSDTSLGKNFADYFVSYFSLYTYVIPISLFVTMELVRLAQGLFMAWDEKMVLMRQPAPNAPSTEEPERVPFKANNTNLNEDLGAIDYIFSDKTGTLTQNEMRLAKWYVDGIEFDDMKDKGGFGRAIRDAKLPKGTLEHMQIFARAIALCHDAIPSVDERSHKMIYEAQSPDESALLYGMVNSGVTLTFRAKSTLRLTNADNQTETYEILNTLEFNSDRKRMSVIVRHPDTGKIALFCKGADNIIMARLSTDQSKNPAERLTKTDTALREFSETGLRTLMVAFRELTEDEYETFAEEYDAAENALADRETKVAEVAEKIERDLVLLGCTAIEDRLQDLVPESIEYLLRCGIRLWVLTGDKKETAINIGMSSRIIRQGMAVLVLAVPNPTVESLTARVNQLITELAERTGVTRESILSPTEAPDTRTTQPADACLVVTGENLAVILGNPALEPAFLRLGVRCHSVICCRVTPLQKALVVKMVKDGLHAMTLAIGDGANDVSMIQGADVGVGIKGREGNQAVRSADYAMGEFRFLTRLVAVHGRYSYMRLAGLIFYSLYKNFTFITVQWWFGFYSSWSGQTVYEDIFFISFNVVFTSLPPLFFAMFEKDVDEDKIEEHPELYMQVRDGSYWNWTVILTTLLSPIWHSIVIFFGYVYLQSDSILSSSGRSSGFWVQCFYLGTPMLTTVLCKQALVTRHFIWITFFGLLLSLFLDPIVQVAVEYLNFGSEPGTFVIQHGMLTFYLAVTGIVVACLLPDVTLALARRMMYPTDVDIVMEGVKLEKREHRGEAEKGKAAAKKGRVGMAGEELTAVEMEERFEFEEKACTDARAAVERANACIEWLCADKTYYTPTLFLNMEPPPLLRPTALFRTQFAVTAFLNAVRHHDKAASHPTPISFHVRIDCRPFDAQLATAALEGVNEFLSDPAQRNLRVRSVTYTYVPSKESLQVITSFVQAPACRVHALLLDPPADQTYKDSLPYDLYRGLLGPPARLSTLYIDAVGFGPDFAAALAAGCRATGTVTTLSLCMSPELFGLFASSVAERGGGAKLRLQALLVSLIWPVLPGGETGSHRRADTVDMGSARLPLIAQAIAAVLAAAPSLVTLRIATPRCIAHLSDTHLAPLFAHLARQPAANPVLQSLSLAAALAEPALLRLADVLPALPHLRELALPGTIASQRALLALLRAAAAATAGQRTLKVLNVQCPFSRFKPIPGLAAAIRDTAVAAIGTGNALAWHHPDLVAAVRANPRIESRLEGDARPPPPDYAARAAAAKSLLAVGRTMLCRRPPPPAAAATVDDDDNVNTEERRRRADAVQLLQQQRRQFVLEIVVAAVLSDARFAPADARVLVVALRDRRSLGWLVDPAAEFDAAVRATGTRWGSAWGGSIGSEAFVRALVERCAAFVACVEEGLV